MELTATRDIAAPRDQVWAALNSAEVLRDCIPGCEEMTGSPQDGFAAVVKQKIGPVRATFKGAVTLSDVIAGESYRISGEGKGGVAGFAKGAATVELADSDSGGTTLSYHVDASVGGKLAQLGSRLIDGAARRIADEFFERLQTRLETGSIDA
ncbi:MAG: carbon monoxide dehydrogenase subunit G [Pseudomonadota bacterium]